LSDVHTPAQRSYNMSRIRGRNTRPELALRKALWREGLRYRLSVNLPGRPDLTFRKTKVVVFVDGCFWHACPKHLIWPRNNANFWKRKISGNVARDKKATRELRRTGWLVFRFWEHDVECRLQRCVNRVISTVKQRAQSIC
jgi:DNA mismatch endonuclease (patch repair protein)